MLISILKVITHSDPKVFAPMNRAVATSALSHQSVEVRECAVRAYEYWEDPTLFIDLQMRPLQPDWLEEYKQLVISEGTGGA